ncbi:DUF6124 family protein [Pseudomonas fluorescens]|uniref:DUF3077 domain-containing protein n=1 Tax=Pseudomonas fluorescens TaxID=294 RepID=A0A5E7CVB4_PSEFL|nr:DUF6124 family protein [Pseudomonas fluorescens]VVO08973.1 hypothetical protein PS723_03259 [Pseudomonas fluorescens]
MKKITPNPPETPSLSAYAFLDCSKLREAAESALDFQLTPPLDKPKLDKRPDNLFALTPDVDTETLLVHASETLASLNVMTPGLAFELEGSRRNVALAIQQRVVLGELLVNRALDNLASQASVVKPTAFQ